MPLIIIGVPIYLFLVYYCLKAVHVDHVVRNGFLQLVLTITCFVPAWQFLTAGFIFLIKVAK